MTRGPNFTPRANVRPDGMCGGRLTGKVGIALLLTAALYACAPAGIEPVTYIDAPAIDTSADHGPVGDPTDNEGCRRDFCPSAWPERAALRVHVTGFLFCACTCEPESVRHPIGKVMWWTANPWPPELLEPQREGWRAFCPRPAP